MIGKRVARLIIEIFCRKEHKYGKETMEKTLSREAPQMDISIAKELLSGKKGFICQYDRDTGKDTVWSVIYDLKHHKIYRAEGNPARCVYQEDQRVMFQPNKQ